MDLLGAFTQHPASVGESYARHMGRAAYFGSRMLLAGIACLIHAAFPFLFQHTGSRAIAALHEELSERRRGASRPFGGATRFSR